jgi:hypothetical protein
MTRAMIGNC